MQVLRIALQREQEAEDYYRTLAAGCPDTGMALVMNRLADTEQRHQNVIRHMMEKTLDLEVDDPAFLDAVREQLKAMADAPRTFDFDREQVDMYRHARDREQQSFDLYTKASLDSKDASARAIFARLASQEQLHFQIMDSIVQFVERAEPGRWLENAEWYHTEAY